MSHLKAECLVVILAAALGALQSGCGGTCRRLERDRRAFLERAEATPEPHIEFSVPFAVAEEHLSRYLGEIEPLPLAIPIPAALAGYFGRLEVKPREVRLRPAEPGRLAFRLVFEVRDKDRNRRVFDITMDVETEPEIDLERRRLIIEITPESLGTADPEISEDATTELVGMVWERIPKLVRLAIPRRAVEDAAGSLVRDLVRSFYRVSKDKMLARLGDLSRVTLKLPDLPLRSLTIESKGDPAEVLRLHVVTTLPVRSGVRPGEAPADRVAVRLSGSAVAELGNWAMSKGLLPDRLDGKGKPKADGEFRPGLDWVPGKRPMKIILWDLDGTCMRLTLESDAELGVEDGKLAFETRNAKFTDISASAFVKAAVWFRLLWKDAFSLARKAETTTVFTVAGRELEISIAAAGIVEDEIVLGLDVMTR